MSHIEALVERWRGGSLLELQTLAIRDSLVLECQADRTRPGVLVIKVRRRPFHLVLGPPACYLPPRAVDAEFCVVGCITSYNIITTSALQPGTTTSTAASCTSTTIKFTLSRRDNPVSEVLWERIVDTINAVIRVRGPARDDTSTLFTPGEQRNDLLLFVEGRHIAAGDEVCSMLSVPVHHVILTTCCHTGRQWPWLSALRCRGAAAQGGGTS